MVCNKPKDWAISNGLKEDQILMVKDFNEETINFYEYPKRHYPVIHFTALNVPSAQEIVKMITGLDYR